MNVENAKNNMVLRDSFFPCSLWGRLITGTLFSHSTVMG